MEWKLTPEYILNEWTEEELNLLVSKYIKRHKPKPEKRDTVSDSALFGQLGMKVKKR